MKLKDCDLNVDVAVLKPLIRNRPEDSWVSAKESNLIPNSLYQLYVLADFFSFDKCPRFLADENRMLFPHLEVSLNLIRTSFEDYHELIALMKKHDSDMYNVIKKIKGEPFDPAAPKHFQRNFQLLMINLYSVLDCLAEIIAIILCQGTLYRPEFSKIVNDIEQDKVRTQQKNGIVTVEDNYGEKITRIIQKQVFVEGPAKDWFKLFKLYRNKLAHFRYYSTFLLCDKTGKFYHFLPNRWPYYFQQDIKESDKSTKQDTGNLYFEFLMEQDIFEYCDGLHKTVFRLTDDILIQLNEAFKIKKESNCGISDMFTKALDKEFQFKQFG